MLEFIIALNYRLFVPIICWKVALNVISTIHEIHHNSRVILIFFQEAKEKMRIKL